MLAFLKLSSYC